MKKTSKRLRNIIRIIHKHKLIKNRSPENVRQTIEELGPTFVKMGQIMASRGDLITEEYALEFKKLRCSVNPMDMETVKRILEQEYMNYQDIFLSIESSPLGSASIAQTHLGYLKDGTPVAIKIQRENIYDIMKTDAKLLKKAINILHLNKLFGNIADLNVIIDEMFERSKEEMDFIMEANHIVEFAKNNNDISYIKPLNVYKEYSTKHVLVMEYIDGLFVDDVDGLTKSGYDLEEISYKLANNYLKQVIDDGFYHADPHADNIKVSDGKIIFLDLGMMGRLTKQNKDLLNKGIIAIVKNDINDISYVLTTLNINNEPIDYMCLNSDIDQVLTKNKVADIKDIDIKCFIKDVFKLLADNSIKLPQDITMLIRGITVLEGTLEVINPNINLISVLKNRIGIKDIINRDTIETSIFNGIKSLQSLSEIPNEALKFFKGVNEGKIQFSVKLSDDKAKAKQKESLVWTGIITALDFAFIIGICIIDRESLSFVYHVYLCGFILCTFILLIKYIKSNLK